MKTIAAYYENGVFKPVEPIVLPEHAEVRVEVPDNPGAPASTKQFDRSEFCGILKDHPLDPLEFQRQIREEWD